MCTRRGHRCICKMHKKVHWTCINHFLRAHPTRAHFEAGAMQFFVRFSSGLFFYFSLASTFRAVHINFSFHPLTLSNLWTSHIAIADAMLSAQHQKLIFFSRRKTFQPFSRLMHSSFRCEKLLSRVNVERLESSVHRAFISFDIQLCLCKNPHTVIRKTFVSSFELAFFH